MISKICAVCGNEFSVINSRKDSAKFCSKKCLGIKLKAEKNMTCTQCGCKFHLKESQMKRHKRNLGYFCTTKCVAEYMKKEYLGRNNPNYRRVERDGDGYLFYDNLDMLPKFGRIKLHHKIVFECLNIDKLPDGYCVHHRDCEIENNLEDNLVLLTLSDHRWLHKNFGNATLWAYINNRVTLDELCQWCKNPEKARLLLSLNIIKQNELKEFEK